MPAPDAAVAIVRTRDPDERVLLIRRAEREGDPWSGHWSFPGGRRDRLDPDLLHTALRELEEECGIQLDRDQLEAELPPSLARRRTPPFLVVAPFVFAIDGARPAVLDTREAVEALWLPLSVLRDPACHRLRLVAGMPPNMLFPAVDLPVCPLWGFTYRLISDWLSLAPEQSCAEAAQAVLDSLLARGLTLASNWNNGVAEIEGAIPAEQIIEEFSQPRRSFPPVNLLEIRPDLVHAIGLAFEEYRIQAATPPPPPAPPPPR